MQTEEQEEAWSDDYDSPWKEAVERYFKEFMAFYFPEAFVQIDWAQEYVFLDQELRAVVHDAELGKRFVDKLVRVTLLKGGEKWIYIHIEVQGFKQSDFSKRMFVYNYRIFDRYETPVASLAVLADEQANWRPAYFGYSLLGCETSIRFPVAKLMDYQDKLAELQATDNVFALVTATHLLTQRTRKKDDERYEAKRMLVRILYQRQWDKQRVIDLFRVIDWMMKLPESLEQQLWVEIEAIEEKEKMQYVTSVERMAIARGLAKGLEQGLEQGIKKGLEQGRELGRELGREQGREQGRVEGLEAGVIEGQKKTLQRLLQRRFQLIPDWAVERILNASNEELGQWLDNVLDASSIEAVFTEQSSSH